MSNSQGLAGWILQVLAYVASQLLSSHKLEDVIKIGYENFN
jgi:hypothetical protein